MTIQCRVWGYARLCLGLVLLFAFGVIAQTQPSPSADISSPPLELTAQEQQWLKDHPVVRFAIPSDLPALTQADASGKPQGYLIDYFNLLASRAGFRFEYHPMLFPEMIDATNNDQTDVYVASVIPLEKEHFLIADPFFSLPLVIITRVDVEGFTGHSWLAGKKVAVYKGMVPEYLAKNDPLGLEVVPFHTIPEALWAVSYGQADAMIAGQVVTSMTIAQEKITNLKIAGRTDYPNYDASVAIRKDWPVFLGIINKANATITPTQKRQMLEQWLVPQEQNTIDWIRFLKIAGSVVGVLLFLLLASIIWNHQLKRQVARRTEELRVSNEILKVSEKRFRDTFEQAAVGIAHVLPEGRIIRANQRLCELLGYPLEELINKNFRDITHPDSLADDVQMAQRMINREVEIYRKEKPYIKSDGSFFWIHLTTRLTFDDDNNPQYFISVIEDINETVLNRDRIVAAHRQLQNVLDASFLSMIIATDQQGTITIFNSGAQRILGYSPQEMIGKRTPMLFHLQSEIQERAKLHSERLNRPIKGFEVFVAQAELASYEECQWTLVHKDGHHIHANLGLTCIRDEQDKVVGILGVAQDITEQIKAQQELREKEERLRITLRSIGDAVIATDNEGVVMQMNPVAESLTGWAADDAIGQSLQNVFQIINAQTRLPVSNPVQKVLECGEVVGLANHTVLVSSDGTEYQIADSGAPIRSDTGQIVGVVLVFRDVTGEYAMEQQLRQSEKMQAIGQLAGGIAHDFNNMLGGILGSAELLSEKLLHNPEATELMKIIMQSGKRAADLTSNLLAFSRKEPSASRTMDVHRVIGDAITLLKQTIDRRIDIDFKTTDSTALINGDASQLQNAFLNLGINASHAMTKGGKLTIQTQPVTFDDHDRYIDLQEIKPGKYLKIDITDTGIGIAPQHLNRIFEPFFTTKEHGEGTGLGLAAVFSTIKQHDGIITVKSELRKGSCFSIYLPLAGQDSQLTEPHVDDSRIAGTGHIMVVDDEKVMRVTARATLEDLGYQVTLAEDGLEALELFKRNPQGYDLVVLDMMMPKLNGKDCFLAMKKLNPSIRVILSTGYTPESELLAMKAAGLTAWITKPYLSGPLSQKIQEVLSQVD